MATRGRTIHLQPDAYELLAREAARRGVAPDDLADELVRSDLNGLAQSDLGETLDALAAFRAQLPEADAVDLVAESRAELESRGS